NGDRQTVVTAHAVYCDANGCRRHLGTVFSRLLEMRAAMRAGLLVVLGLENLAAAVETVGADVVTQVQFARGRLDGRGRVDQCIVRTMHAALRRTFLVLLNGHDE